MDRKVLDLDNKLEQEILFIEKEILKVSKSIKYLKNKKK